MRATRQVFPLHLSVRCKRDLEYISCTVKETFVPQSAAKFLVLTIEISFVKISNETLFIRK